MESLSMERILIRLHVNLEEFDLPEHVRPNGPLFHRWLPNGEQDAIKIPVDDDRIF